MKPKSTSILLCALLISTLAHDYLNHHRHHQAQNRVSNQHHEHSKQKLLSHSVQKRDFDGGCDWWCPPSSHQPEDIKIVINATTNITGLVNITANYGIAFDISSNIVLLLNGNNGHFIIIDVESQIGVHVTGGNSSYRWVASQRTFEAYINSLTSLKKVYSYALTIGAKFNVSTASQEILHLVSETLVALGTGKYIRKDLSNSVLLVIGISDRLNNVLNGTLDGIFDLFAQTTLTVNVSLARFTDIFEGLAVTIGRIKGGISTFLKNNIRLDLRVIIDAKSGIEIIAYIINVQLVAGIDVVQVGPPNGFSIESLFGVIVELSDSNSGYGGFVRVIGLTIDLTNGTVSVGVLIAELVKFVTNGGVSGNVRSEFSASLKDLLNVLEKVNVNGTINGTIVSINELISGNLTLAKVNIKSIEDILAEAKNIPAIVSVLEVLLAIQSVVTVSVSIPSLLVYILAQLNTSFGVGIIMKLFPTVKIDESLRAQADGTILADIFKNVTTSDLVSTDFDVVKILRKLPVVKNIYVIIYDILDPQIHIFPPLKRINLDALFKSGAAGGVVKKILTLLGDALHFDLTRAVYVNVAARAGHHHHEDRKYINKHIDRLKHGGH